MKKLNYLKLKALIDNPETDSDYRKQCQQEMLVRWISASSVEEGKRQLKSLMTAWVKDGSEKADAETLLIIISDSITRCGNRKSLLVPLRAAKNKLETVL